MNLDFNGNHTLLHLWSNRQVDFLIRFRLHLVIDQIKNDHSDYVKKLRRLGTNSDHMVTLSAD
jgi:hypothetical protein